MCGKSAGIKSTSPAVFLSPGTGCSSVRTRSRTSAPVPLGKGPYRPARAFPPSSPRFAHRPNANIPVKSSTNTQPTLHKSLARL